MLYATPQDFIEMVGLEEVIRLTDNDDAPGVVDESRLTFCLQRASSEVDGFVSHLYRKPLVGAHPLLIGLTCDLTRYHLSTTGGRLTTDEIRDRHVAAVRMLRLIANGEVKIGQADAAPAVDPGPTVHLLSDASASELSDAMRDYP